MAAMIQSRDRVTTLSCILALAAVFPLAFASAQVMPGRLPFPGESRAAANRLIAADKLAADKQWSEAIDEYVHILEEAGDDLVPLDSGHYLCARRLCHARLTAMPTEALRLYRDRVES